ncbi:MAG: PAS domain S-box protein [Bacteroidales bacterium]|jgi:PAS domain S-box-containing protein
MNDQDKTKGELLKRIQELQHENNSLKASYQSDLNERKRTEEALRNSEEKFRVFFESAEDGIFQFNIDGTIVAVNESFARMHGYTVDELIEKNFKDFETPETNRFAHERMQKVLAGESIVFEVEHFCKNGQTIPIEVSANLVTLGDKKYFLGFHRDITERKLAEVELKKLKKAVENSGEVMFMTDKNGLFTFVNPAFTEVYGYKADEVVGKTTPRILKSGMMETTDFEGFWLTLLNKQVIKGELINKTKDGKLVNIEGSANPVFDESGDINGFLAIQRDITERKRADENWRKISSRFEAILASVPDIIMEVDANKTYTWANIAGKDFFGEDVIGKEAGSYFQGEQETYHIVQPLFNGANDNIIYLESWQNRKDGVKRLLAWWCRVLKDNDGIVTGALSVAQDITERKRAEIIQQIQFNIIRKVVLADTLEQLSNTIREELNKLLDTTNFFVALYNQETDTLRQVIFKDQKDHFTEWKSGESLSGQVIKRAKTLLLKGPEIIEFAKERKLNPLGTMAECWLGVPLMSEKQAIGVMVIQNYTDPNMYDQTSSDLMEMVAHELSLYIERIKMIDDLVVAKKRAEESDRLKSAFLANMSHEIRTPMNGILGFTELLKEPDLTGDEKNNYISIIEKSGDRLLNTINDILDISKIESGQMELTISEVDINEKIKYLYTFFKPETEQKGIQIFFKNSLPDKEATIKTDGGKIYAILTNLIKNAIKFTITGSVEFGYEKKDHYFEFFVKDTGRGIRQELKKIIFERFRQGSESINRSDEGTGLGLTIAKAHVEMLGGKIWMESQEGKGSVFYFTIPC